MNGKTRTKGNFISSMKQFPNSLPIFVKTSSSGHTPHIVEGWYNKGIKFYNVFEEDEITDTTNYKPCLIIV